MNRKDLVFLLVVVFLMTLIPKGLPASGPADNAGAVDTQRPSISLPEGMDTIMAKEITKAGKHFKKGVSALFERTPLGFDFDTIDFLKQWLLTLHMKVPALLQHVMEQGRLLGAVGSLIMLAFIVAVLYSLIGQRRVLARVEKGIQPLREKMPEAFYLYFRSFLKVVVASLIPLALLGAFWLINLFIDYDAPWFLLIGRLLGLWVVGALLINLLHESLTKELFSITSRYGRSIYRVARIVLFYILACIAMFWGAAAFQVPEDVLELLRFLISLSIVFVLLLLLLKKRSLLSLLPALPYRSYQAFVKGLDRFYFPAIFLTFLTGLLWCAGYHHFCKVLWLKTWAVAGTFIGIMIFYHWLQGWLKKWVEKKGANDEEAQFLYRSVKALLLYATVTVVITLTLHLLGLLDPIGRLMSFSILKIGSTPLSLWIILKAILILFAFVYCSRLLRAYLDYKIYPSIGVDTGLAYAINTFLSYFLLTIGCIFSLWAMGIDLRMLMVFAGAIGIGIGLGLQNVAANIISGFSLIFGKTLRKGNWVQVGDTQGMVQEIGLRATMIRTRDNVEYLVPNSAFSSGMVINYTLSSPLIRVHVPVGVSYGSDPEEVRRILLEEAKANPKIDKANRPEVWFDAYGESSINFVLLVWIDLRLISENQVRSELYFAIFKALKQAGIEMPFPQRDIHIRSVPSSPEVGKQSG